MQGSDCIRVIPTTSLRLLGVKSAGDLGKTLGPGGGEAQCTFAAVRRRPGPASTSQSAASGAATHTNTHADTLQHTCSQHCSDNSAVRLLHCFLQLPTSDICSTSVTSVQ